MVVFISKPEAREGQQLEFDFERIKTVDVEIDYNNGCKN